MDRGRNEGCRVAGAGDRKNARGMAHSVERRREEYTDPKLEVTSDLAQRFNFFFGKPPVGSLGQVS